MDQHFDCRAEVIENDEMDQQLVCDAEIYNSLDYNQELVDTTVPKRIGFLLYIFLLFIVFLISTATIFFIFWLLSLEFSYCAVGWCEHDMTCYTFNVGDSFSWSQCKSECTSLGASMLCIPDSRINNWIANQISQQGYKSSWIGFSDLPYIDGNYQWVSGCSSKYTYSTDYNYNNYFFIKDDGAWNISHDSGSSSITCSCEYSISTSKPAYLKFLVTSCILSSIFILIIICFFYIIRMNKICISTRNESPTNNDINSSDQAYTDIPPTCPYPPSDDDDDDNGVAISSSTEELQVVMATNHYYNDTLPMDHRTEFIPVAVLIESNVMNCI